MLLIASPATGNDNQVTTGGLYRDGELVDSFVEPLPSLGSGTKEQARTLDAATESGGTQVFR